MNPILYLPGTFEATCFNLAGIPDISMDFESELDILCKILPSNSFDFTFCSRLSSINELLNCKTSLIEVKDLVYFSMGFDANGLTASACSSVFL